MSAFSPLLRGLNFHSFVDAGAAGWFPRGLLLGLRASGWWAGGPRKKGRKPKFIQKGESLYRVESYRLAYRRFFGRDTPIQDQEHTALRKRYAAEAAKARNKGKAYSSPAHAKQTFLVTYPYEKKHY
mmetsp:Transcript_80303/g.186485  ORF Transcript_80303/g.186485 Transcript_80303/m.186485 type:complete len:127 (+) Transcript_80303:58-438(+)